MWLAHSQFGVLDVFPAINCLLLVWITVLLYTRR